MPADDSQLLSLLVDRLQAGDATAREELIRAAHGRLEQLARKMLRQFPKVARWEQTDDVLQNALLRLDRALKAVVPESSRKFLGLAAEQMRRELLDMARHYQGAMGLGRNHQSGIQVGEAESQGGLDPSDGSPEEAELERWTAFHESVAKLSEDDREVFMLTFYHGCTQVQIAEQLGIDERTVRRRWRTASLRLNELVGGDLPV